MPARRSSIPELIAALVLVAGCQDKPAPSRRGPDAGQAPASSAAMPAKTASAPPSPLADLSAGPARRGLVALVALADAMPRGRGDDNGHYLELRRALAAGAPLWRRPESLGGEVVFGPLRSRDESGGALLRLDAALVAGDAAAAGPEMASIQRALRLFESEASRIPPAPRVVAQTASLAAYELGALALESSQGLPEGPAAVLADLRGTLDYIAAAAAVLADAASPGAKAELSAALDLVTRLRTRLDVAKTSNDLHDRASFVLDTGHLGAALRRLAKAAGLPARLPYQPRFSRGAQADEPISALTLPAGRPFSEAESSLGRILFFDKRLSKNNSRSCATCHAPERGFADGLARPPSLDPAVTLRHTPTLLYAPLSAAFLWDGRALTPERQALGVIHARAEMGRSDAELEKAMRAAGDLRPLFDALPTPGPTAQNVARALAAFESSALVPADAPIDLFARGDEAALSTLERRGLDVFAGKGRCARCHIPPSFGGSRPTDFAVPVFATIGVPDRPSGKTLDPDPGRGAITGRPADERAMKTPTLRDIARTAPYFHHGAFPTLEDVVDLYDRGGGKGIGLSVANQDPDVRPLSLSADERAALLAFLRTALLDRAPPERLVQGAGSSK